MGASVGGGGLSRLPGIGQDANRFQNLVAGSPGQPYGGRISPTLAAVGQQQANLASYPKSGAAQQLVGGAQQGAQYGNQAAQGAAGFGQSLYPQAQTLMGYGNQVANLGMDPQQALYGRTLQQVQDQSRAAEAARGLGSTPYAAGLENQATRNFNIDWQNQLLNRAIQGSQAAGGLDQTAAGLGSSAFNLGSGAASLAQQAGQMPYQAKQGLLQNKANALAGVGPQIQQANQPAQQVIQDYLQFLGMGPAYQSSAAAGQQAQNAFPLDIAKLGLGGIGKGGG